MGKAASDEVDYHSDAIVKRALNLCFFEILEDIVHLEYEIYIFLHKYNKKCSTHKS